MVTVLLAAGLALALVLLVALHVRVGCLPVALWSEAKRERERDARVPKALDAMKEAVAAKAGASVLALQRYEESIAAGFRAQVAEAETRARVSERRIADTATALQAASTLVRELRELVDVARATSATRILPPSTPPPAEADEAERVTREVVRAPERGLPRATSDDGDLGDDDTTRFGKRRCIPPPSRDVQGRPGDEGGAA